MNRRKNRLTISMLGLIAAACLMVATSPAAAQSDREEKWQFYIPITFTSTETFDGESISSFELSGDVGWGFAFGYNFTERWELGFEFTWMDARFDARIPVDNNPPDGAPDGTAQLGGTLTSSSFQVVGQFNFMETRVTPFIRANLGATYTDSNIPSGPPTGTCWWHPWWGYICGTWQPTYDRNSFSYGAGVGVRGDITETFYLELSYNQLWIDLGASSSTPSISAGRLNIGWMF